ncbi:MAG: penicillin-binding protein 1B [Cellvibrionaceae bacterium]
MPKATKKSPVKKKSVGRGKTTRKRSVKNTSQRAWYNPLRWWKVWLGLLSVCFVVFGLGVAYLDHVVRSKFDGKKWSLPARVFARPLELYEGLTINRDQLIAELEALGYQKSRQPTKPGLFSSTVFGVSGYTRGFSFWDKDEKAQGFRAYLVGNTISRLDDLNGNSLPIVRFEPQEIGGIYPGKNEDRSLVRLQDIPPILGQALIAVEDRYFLEHHGVSPRAIVRAAIANIRSGSVVQGGSTLTQQLVKNFYLSRTQSFSRKLIEAIMSLQLDFYYSKAEILETYINEVYLGQAGARAIHGFALGSQHYFRQPLNELKLHQIALLVGEVKGASYYNPWKRPKRAKERRDLVLQIMNKSELISDEEMKAAQQLPLDVVDQPKNSLYEYPAFIDLVKRQLKVNYKEEDLRSEGLRLFTTLSPTVQRSAQKALTDRLKKLEEDFGVNDDELQGAVVVTGVGSGEVLALVGDRNSGFMGFNRALSAKRSIGSLAKPAVFLTALSHPEKYSLVSKIDDEPISIAGDNGDLWQPQNFSRQSHGEVTVLEALALSYNQATARLGMSVGIESVVKTMNDLGVDEKIPPLPSLFLGAIDLTPFQVSNVYQTIASEGVHTPQRAIRYVLDAKGVPLNRYPLDSQTRFSPETVHVLNFGLQTTMRSGTGRSAYQILPSDLNVAGKTGTSNEQRDSWFAGFSSDHLAVVWVGRDDNGPTPLTGATGALKVWSDLMVSIPTRPITPLRTPNVSYYNVNLNDSTVVNERCASGIAIPFIHGSEPKQLGKCKRLSSFDKTTLFEE